jgi:hypothetical protein
MNMAARVSLVVTNWDRGGGKLETILDSHPSYVLTPTTDMPNE